MVTEHIHEVSAALRQIFATLFPVAESPFVANTLLEILGESVEKSFELGTEGKLSPPQKLASVAKQRYRKTVDDYLLHIRLIRISRYPGVPL